MSSHESIVSRTVVMPGENIDTDQIIPAHFLTTTERTGLGQHLFHAWRFDANGEPRADFVLNRPQAAGCQVLVAGHNFGCGSSREHAPWALLDYGFRAVVSTGIADIFRSNALKNGLLPVIVNADVHAMLLARPGAGIEIDLVNTVVQLPDGTSCTFEIDEFSRHCLVNGLDELGFLLTQTPDIERFETERQP